MYIKIILGFFKVFMSKLNNYIIFTITILTVYVPESMYMYLKYLKYNTCICIWRN